MLCRMALIALSSTSLRNALEYVQVMESLGVDVRLMVPETEGGFSLRGTAPRQKALLSWEPSSPGPDRRLIL